MVVLGEFCKVGKKNPKDHYKNDKTQPSHEHHENSLGTCMKLPDGVMVKF